MTNPGCSQDVEPDPEPAEIEGSVAPNGHLCSQALLEAVWNPMEPEWNPSSKPTPLCSGVLGFEIPCVWNPMEPDPEPVEIQGGVRPNGHLWLPPGLQYILLNKSPGVPTGDRCAIAAPPWRLSDAVLEF